MMKDTSEEPDEVIQRVRSGRVRVKLGCITLPDMDVLTNLEALRTPYPWDTLGILRRFPHVGMIDY